VDHSPRSIRWTSHEVRIDKFMVEKLAWSHTLMAGWRHHPPNPQRSRPVGTKALSSDAWSDGRGRGSPPRSRSGGATSAVPCSRRVQSAIRKPHHLGGLLLL
jgi:hypothetical protein